MGSNIYSMLRIGRLHLSMGVFVIACLGGDRVLGQAREYRETAGEVTRIKVQQVDSYLRVAVFVQLDDGTLQRAKIYSLQPHQTLIGTRRVEKNTGVFNVTTT